MRTGRDRLFEGQLPLFDEATNIEPHKISLFEAPTGFGKSVIINTIAEALAQKKKKIIIATPTNQLAKELLDVFKNDKAFKFDENLKTDIVVGRKNYFDLDLISADVFEYIDKEQFQEYVKNIANNEDYLIETLFNIIDIEEPNKKIVEEMISCKKTKSFMKDFSELDISFTNFAYLLTNVFHVKDFDISKYVVIADEVHQLVESAENLLTNSFSVFRYRNISSQLQKQIEKCEGVKNKSNITSMLQEQSEILGTLLNAYSNESRAGEFYTLDGSNKEHSVINDIQDFLINKKIHKKKDEVSFHLSLHDLLTKAVKESGCKEIETTYRLYSGERSEMLGVLASPQDVTVYLSPSKGYPTLNSAKGDVRGWLLSFLWDKVESFIGLSATIRTSKDDKTVFGNLGVSRGTFDLWLDKLDTAHKFSLAYGRLPREDDAGYEKIAHFLETQKRGYEQGWLEQRKKTELITKLGVSFFQGLEEGAGDPLRKENKQKIEHIKYIQDFSPVFSKEQAKIFVPKEDLMEPQEIGSQKEEAWFNMLVDSIAKNYEGKNTLVICGVSMR
ncbi:MAG: box helicase family protein [Campylobacterota bacterium]|nr:box helicase family protein [Campylobacterota bacterium]